MSYTINSSANLKNTNQPLIAGAIDELISNKKSQQANSQVYLALKEKSQAKAMLEGVALKASRTAKLGERGFSWGARPSQNTIIADDINIKKERDFEALLLGEEETTSNKDEEQSTATIQPTRSDARPSITFDAISLRSVQRIMLERNIKQLLKQAKCLKVGLLKLTNMQYSLIPSIILAFRQKNEAETYKLLQTVNAKKTKNMQPNGQLEGLIYAFIEFEAKNSTKRREQLLAVNQLSHLKITSSQMAAMCYYAKTELVAQQSHYKESDYAIEAKAISSALVVISAFNVDLKLKPVVGQGQIEPITSNSLIANKADAAVITGESPTASKLATSKRCTEGFAAVSPFSFDLRPNVKSTES